LESQNVVDILLVEDNPRDAELNDTSTEEAQYHEPFNSIRRRGRSAGFHILSWEACSSRDRQPSKGSIAGLEVAEGERT